MDILRVASKKLQLEEQQHHCVSPHCEICNSFYFRPSALVVVSMLLEACVTNIRVCRNVLQLAVFQEYLFALL